MKLAAGLLILGFVWPTALATSPAQRTLTFEERVAAQKAIEQVYWKHRIWPNENPDPKPPLSDEMNDDTVRAKVDDYLRKSSALDTWWQRPITSEQLQAEMDRMAAGSRDPRVLQELFAALEDDPFLIAETLARQTLVDRLIRNWYTNDPRFHADARAKANAALASCASVDCMKSMSGEYRETTVARRDEEKSERGERARKRVLRLNSEEWRRERDRLAESFGTSAELLPSSRLSRLDETAESFVVSAVLSDRQNEITTASMAWPKQTFDAWWTVNRPTQSLRAATSGSFTLPEIPSVACTANTWTTAGPVAPDPRFAHAAVWTGTEMIVWGGFADAYGGDYLNSGARYNPATDSWTVMAVTAATPTKRFNFTAVWTGSRMIVWGGQTDNAALNTGGRYNPMTDTWTATSTSFNTPEARTVHTAVWTGTEMIIWGGSGNGLLNTGGRYNPNTNVWAATSTGADVPSPRYYHTAVWTGTEMIVWGGDGTNTGGRYNPTTNTWLTTSIGANTPAERSYHKAVWTGTEMIVWGGYASSLRTNTGGRYNPSTDAWTSTSVGANVPTGRVDHTAVWTGSRLVIWGGDDNGGNVNTGGRYDPSTDSWSATSTGANVPAERVGHTAVWTGTEMIVWGGLTDFPFTELSSGGRYNPTTDSWVPTSTGVNVPSARHSHTAVWTGAEMIVWGGIWGGAAQERDGLNTGGRYSPSTDSWTATSTGANVPEERTYHTAVWTGREMIVWGGANSGSLAMGNGARYNPLTDSWIPIYEDSGIRRRFHHTAVWTGREMIIWGGTQSSGGSEPTDYFNSGGRYDPSTDTWVATSIGASVPAVRQDHTAVWTGTEMIVWGGYVYNLGPQYLGTGGRYNPTTNTWTSTSLGGSPPGRNGHTAIWTGTEMILWGGYSGTTRLNSGGRYDPGTNTWVSTSTGSNVPSVRENHIAVWTGAEMLVFGGYDGSSFLNSGGRYSPPTNIWTTTSTGASVPEPREYTAAVSTGPEVIVWGGWPLTSTGARYCACPNGRLIYRDADGDGYGIAGVPTPSCDGSIPAGFVADGSDCYDADPNVHLGGTESCNGLDDDCDGTADNNLGAQCDDGNICTTDSCGGAGGCVHPNNAIACNDGNACTTNDACVGGVCSGGAPLACNDGDPCTIDGCNPATGCTSTFSAGPCNDGNPCTSGDTCGTGVCTGPPNDGAACNDGNVCTTGDTCVGGSCSPGAVPLNCNDGNVCTNDSCASGTGCLHANNTNACNDGNACTLGDACGGGSCHAGTPNACDDGNACTDGSCNPTTGACAFTNDDTNTCSDGNPCTQTDVCQSGSCTGSNPVNCSAGCPAGFSLEGGFCVKAYLIGASLLDNQDATCGGTSNRYNSCNGGNYGFHWTDLGNSLAAVANVDIEIETGRNCGGSSSSATLNGAPIGLFPLLGNCSCPPTHTPIGLPSVDVNLYVMGGLNAISITPGGSCEGLSIGPDIGNAFARVTVSYVPQVVSPCQVGVCVPSTGICEFSDLPAPSEASGVTVEKSGSDATIAWTPAPNSTASEVLRGDIASLPVGPGGGDEVCLGSTTATTTADTDVLAAGSGVWYLVRGSNACAGSGPLGFQGVQGGQGATRASTTCP